MENKALSINNKNPFILNGIAISFMENNEFDKAEEYFKRAIKADKNYGRAYGFLGDLYEIKK